MFGDQPQQDGGAANGQANHPAEVRIQTGGEAGQWRLLPGLPGAGELGLSGLCHTWLQSQETGLLAAAKFQDTRELDPRCLPTTEV